jgi:hypothetical protein
MQRYTRFLAAPWNDRGINLGFKAAADDTAKTRTVIVRHPCPSFRGVRRHTSIEFREGG